MKIAATKISHPVCKCQLKTFKKNTPFVAPLDTSFSLWQFRFTFRTFCRTSTYIPSPYTIDSELYCGALSISLSHHCNCYITDHTNNSAMDMSDETTLFLEIKLELIVDGRYKNEISVHNRTCDKCKCPTFHK